MPPSKKAVTAFTPDKPPSSFLDLTQLETIRPFGQADFFRLLETHPPASWTKMIEILANHHLLLLPSTAMIPSHVSADLLRPTDSSTGDELFAPESEIVLQVDSADASSTRAKAIAHRKRTTQQQAAAAARKQTRAAQHAKRVAEQQAAAATRKANRLKTNQLRVDAAKARTTAASSELTTYSSLKKGSDVVRHAQYLLSKATSAVVSASGCSQLDAAGLLSTIPPPRAERLASRKPRPLHAELPRSAYLADKWELVAPAVLQLTTLYNRLDLHLSRMYVERKSAKRKAGQTYANVVNIQPTASPQAPSKTSK